MKTHYKIEQLRSYSTIFKNSSFKKLLINNDFSFLDDKIMKFDANLKGNKTYIDYLKLIYKILSREYRCEYIYKNTLINELLIKKYKLRDTIAFNEFNVSKSIVDLAIFNGDSKAFEIKTELDSPQRLLTQLNDYQKLFNKCYIVTFESIVEKYLKQDDRIGVITISKNKNTFTLKEIKPATYNPIIDPEVLIRSIRTNEYKNIIKNYFGFIPNVNSFQMFDECLLLLKKIPTDKLNHLFIQEIKKRKLNKKSLSLCSNELRHIYLSLNIDLNKHLILEQKLSQII